MSVLNEYCSRALKCGPLYEQIENSDKIQKDHKTYQVKLPDGKIYGTGSGPNQQAAKNVAALEALQTLIKDFHPDDKNMLTGRAQADIAYFNHVKVFTFISLHSKSSMFFEMNSNQTSKIEK